MMKKELKKELKKNIASCVFTLAIALVAAAGLTTADVYADNSVDYVEKSWSNFSVRSTNKTQDNCIPISVCGERISTGWYYVDQNKSYGSSDRLYVTGTVNLILTDGKRLSCNDGINVPAGSTLNIYAQAGGTGELVCYADTNDNAAIGAENESGDCGTINIHGGIITADAKKYGTDGAGIGGGDEGNGGTVTIYDGKVTAIGGKYGAGIGGGDQDGGKGGNGGKTFIYGGEVTATGGENGAGIGGGELGSGGETTIFGGKVTATGGTDGAGIGGGDEGKSGGIIKIDANPSAGTEVTATGGTNAAGIGGGNYGTSGNISISNATVTAKGGSSYTDGGAGIGGGNEKGGDEIYIGSGNVTATGGGDAAGIGGGDCGDGGKITIVGGYVTATGGSCGAGIGGGEDGNGGTINIDIMMGSNKVVAKGGKYGAGIGGGDNAGCGNVKIARDAKVEATGGSCGAGIGSGDEAGDKNGTITIEDGNVTATGGADAAGIGGGNQGHAGTIHIKSGTVVAKCGGSLGAGIGGGDQGSGGTITIDGGKITATGGYKGAGIGGGDGLTGGNAAGNSGNITINGGEITATGGDEAAGIGGGNQGKKDNPGTITINGGIINATGGEYYAAGIGGGDQQSGGNIEINGGEVTARAGIRGAGIGGGDKGSGGNITITGGTVNATADYNVDVEMGDRTSLLGGAGIGGGSKGDGGTITISGSANVKVLGGEAAAGIGGGSRGKSGKIVINSGTVEARGYEGGAGIGSGAMCEEKSDTTVDVTINGGNIKAIGGSAVFDLTINTGGDGDQYRYYYTGAAIGAGGCMYQDAKMEFYSYFTGSINLNGGTIEASYGGNNDYGVVTIGGLYLGNSSSITVKADATVTVFQSNVDSQRFDTDQRKLMKAGEVKLQDSNGKSSKVYNYSKPSEIAPKANRVDWCTRNKSPFHIVITACDHQEGECTYKDSKKHTKACSNCTVVGTIDEDHVWSEPTYKWSDDYSTVYAERKCEKCTAAEQETAETTAEVTEATCSSEGSSKYTATFNNTAFKAQTKTIELPINPDNHKWKHVRFYPDEEHCGGGVDEYECEYCHETEFRGVDDPGDPHVWGEYEVYSEPTCTEKGMKVRYCTKCEIMDHNSIIILNPTGHDWGKPTYEWAEDNGSVTATRICAHDASHVETETVETTSEVTKPAKCEEKGETTYTAEFENGAFEKQTKTEENIDPIGHDYGEPIYTWGTYVDEDNKEVVYCEAEVLCKHDEDGIHSISKGAIATSEITKRPTCDARGETTYTAEFESGLWEEDYFTTQTKVFANIPRLEHEWGEPSYTWADDYGSVTGVRNCTACGKEETDIASATSETIKEPTCASSGEIAITSSEFSKPGFTVQKTKIKVPQNPNNHVFGAWKKIDDEHHQRVCKHDGYAETGDHKWDAGKVTRKPTEKAEGVKTYTCTVCKATRTESIPKVKPSAGTYLNTEGNNQVWYKGSEKSADFVFKRTKKDSETFTRFVGVMVDGNYVGESNYTAESGSVIIKLKPKYLEKLELGEHELTSVFDDGSVAVAFHVADREKGNPDDKKSDGNDGNGKSGRRGVKTGDSTDILMWIAMMLGATLTLTGTAVHRRKKRS